MSCSDGNCFFDVERKKGMVTNGGCHCLDDIRRSDLNMYLKLSGFAQGIKWKNHELLTENATLKQQLGVAVESLDKIGTLTCCEYPATKLLISDFAQSALAKIKEIGA